MCPARQFTVAEEIDPPTQKLPQIQHRYRRFTLFVSASFGRYRILRRVSDHKVRY